MILLAQKIPTKENLQLQKHAGWRHKQVMSTCAVTVSQIGGAMKQKLIFERIGIYILGLLLMAVGTAFSMMAGLGASPSNVLPYTLHLLSGLPLFWCILKINMIYVLAQIVIERKVRFSHFFQLIFALIFSSLLELMCWLLRDHSALTYIGRLAFVIVGASLIGLGVCLYTTAKLVLMPTDGLVLTLANKTGKKFSTIKNILDCSAVGLSLFFF